MPMRVASVFQHLSRLPAGWVPHGTIPEVEDAVLNKVTFPVGDTFLQHEDTRTLLLYNIKSSSVSSARQTYNNKIELRMEPSAPVASLQK